MPCYVQSEVYESRHKFVYALCEFPNTALCPGYSVSECICFFNLHIQERHCQECRWCSMQENPKAILRAKIVGATKKNIQNGLKDMQCNLFFFYRGLRGLLPGPKVRFSLLSSSSNLRYLRRSSCTTVSIPFLSPPQRRV